MPKWVSSYSPERWSVDPWVAWRIHHLEVEWQDLLWWVTTRPSEMSLTGFEPPCASVVIDAEGVQNIQQGGEEGEELEEDGEH